MATDARKGADMTASITELDQRESNGISVSLLWNRLTNALAVRVFDGACDEEFELACGHDEALDVFHHPYAYAAVRPVTYRLAGAVA
jgi:hypothetical protein